MKFNRAEIMKRAWEIRKAGNPKPTMGEALRSSWAEAKKGEPQKTALDKTADEYWTLRAKIAALEAEMKILEDELKAACNESADGKISGFGWKASYQNIKGHRFDSKALKADNAELFNKYYIETSSMRFNFGTVSV